MGKEKEEPGKLPSDQQMALLEFALHLTALEITWSRFVYREAWHLPEAEAGEVALSLQGALSTLSKLLIGRTSREGLSNFLSEILHEESE